MSKTRPILGRKEKVSFPALGFREKDAKIDTGAYTSSIHCKVIDECVVKGVLCVRFIPFYRRKNVTAREFCLPVVKKSHVKSSSGHAEERYFVELDVVIGNETITTRFSLTDRSDMKYPVLLGRKLLRKRFWVDVSRSYVFHKKMKKANIAEKSGK